MPCKCSGVLVLIIIRLVIELDFIIVHIAVIGRIACFYFLLFRSALNGADLQGYFSLKCAFYPPCALLFLAIRQYDFVAKEHKSSKIHHFKVRSSF